MAVRTVMLLELSYQARDVSLCVHVWDVACLHFPKQYLMIYCMMLLLWQFNCVVTWIQIYIYLQFELLCGLKTLSRPAHLLSLPCVKISLRSNTRSLSGLASNSVHRAACGHKMFTGFLFL